MDRRRENRAARADYNIPFSTEIPCRASLVATEELAETLERLLTTPGEKSAYLRSKGLSKPEADLLVPEFTDYLLAMQHTLAACEELSIKKDVGVSDETYFWTLGTALNGYERIFLAKSLLVANLPVAPRIITNAPRGGAGCSTRLLGLRSAYAASPLPGTRLVFAYRSDQELLPGVLAVYDALLSGRDRSL